jgi:hypothetical protein
MPKISVYCFCCEKLILTERKIEMSIKSILMERDGITADEANAIIAEAKEALQVYLTEDDTCSASEICEEYFGLEPDYIFELL